LPFEVEVEDDPETARLIAAMAPVILKASVRPIRDPEGDPEAVKYLQGRCREWRGLKYPAATIERFLLKALEKVRPFEVGSVERYVASCLNGEAEKRTVPVAPLPAAPTRPEYQKVTMTAEEREIYNPATWKNGHSSNGAKK
jgi:hypothetical protein